MGVLVQLAGEKDTEWALTEIVTSLQSWLALQERNF